MIGRNHLNLIVSWCGRFLFFVVPCQFSQDICEWPEIQILIPGWTYFHCPGATLLSHCEEPHHDDFNWPKQQPSCTRNSSLNKVESWVTSLSKGHVCQVQKA